MDLVSIALAAFFGGILSATLGFLDSKEPFVVRKFGKSIIFALLAGIAFGVGYSFTERIETRDIMLAILSGAGWDSLANRTIGTVAKKK